MIHMTKNWQYVLLWDVHFVLLSLDGNRRIHLNVLAVVPHTLIWLPVVVVADRCWDMYLHFGLFVDNLTSVDTLHRFR